MQRILLYRNELYRVPRGYERLRVVDGTAFVTQAARDRILSSGREMTLDRHGDIALVSALGSDRLVVELDASPSGRQRVWWPIQVSRKAKPCGGLS